LTRPIAEQLRETALMRQLLIGASRLHSSGFMVAVYR
jgi:hypothetical protein